MTHLKLLRLTREALTPRCFEMNHRACLTRGHSGTSFIIPDLAGNALPRLAPGASLPPLPHFRDRANRLQLRSIFGRRLGFDSGCDPAATRLNCFSTSGTSGPSAQLARWGSTLHHDLAGTHDARATEGVRAERLGRGSPALRSGRQEVAIPELQTGRGRTISRTE